MKKYKLWQIVLIIMFFPLSVLYLLVKKCINNPKHTKTHYNISSDQIQTTNYNTVRTPRDIILNKNKISTKFDLSSIVEFQSGYYILSQNDIELAKSDILTLNGLLYAAHKNCPSFPLRKISVENLHFEKRILNGRNAFCFISFEPNTPSGKEAKYPIVLYLDVTQNFFGNIYYLQNGLIGKATITAWKNNECFQLTLHTVNGKLNINNIYKINAVTAIKEKIYSHDLTNNKALIRASK